eukprot:CAMPEP_0179058954 /NCGR_PEP_ID=MMETSP0796-20121207/25111_1 /TAXON_ID=73915 /ORGANISM="Pyrodinium bahamense, Strain pbaha01" /LENGTH=201 /DNA_ID=CAMNT_0020755711 /DNA_START=38 /DNA_END=640 /DNA_ORIENTATION=+
MMGAVPARKPRRSAALLAAGAGACVVSSLSLGNSLGYLAPARHQVQTSPASTTGSTPLLAAVAAGADIPGAGALTMGSAAFAVGLAVATARAGPRRAKSPGSAAPPRRAAVARSARGGEDDVRVCIPLEELRNTDVDKVGGKSASLGEMISQLSDVGVPVPGGFSTTAYAYKEFLDKGGINDFINEKLSDESIYEDVDKLM